MLKHLNFPRSIKPKDVVENLHLVMLSVVSKDAYSAVKYARSQKAHGNHESRLVTQKNRIAPNKVVHFIRLELSVAVISKRFRSTTETETRMSFIMVYHIADNEIA